MFATKAKAYWQLTRMNRPIGTLLLLWPTLWSLIIAAQGMPDFDVLVVFVLGVVLMRSAGWVINGTNYAFPRNILTNSITTQKSLSRPARPM